MTLSPVGACNRYFRVRENSSSFFGSPPPSSKCPSGRTATMPVRQAAVLHFLSLLFCAREARSGCTATTEKACVGGCEWNFVASCCYEKGQANCAVSTSYIATKPAIDASAKVGIDTPGSEASATLKEVPLEPVGPPAFGPTSMGGQSNMVAGGGLTNGLISGHLPGSRRRRLR